MPNHLFYGDNLQVLRDSIADQSVDLIYLDPPFNSNASYNVLFKGPQGNESAAQIEAFDDTWAWGDEAEAAFGEVLRGGNTDVAEMLRAMRVFLGENDMLAYLTMMAVRLVELHRVLKDTGSLYLHCDPTASHYLKILLDAVFGKGNYQNEIIWKRATSHNDAKRYGKITDRILFYTKSSDFLWNGDAVRTPRSEAEVIKSFPSKDERGRFRGSDLTGPAHGQIQGESTKPWNGYDIISRGRVWSAPRTGRYAEYIDRNLIPGYLSINGVHDRLNALDDAGLIVHPKRGFWPGLKRYADSDLGNPAQDLILEPIGFTNFTKGIEAMGYPTQKPVALVEKFVLASSNEGDTILDPFCGCGTTVHAAQKLNRNWIGIDVTHLAIGLIERRLKDAFEGIKFETHGTPTDLGGAQALADADKYEFEKWALSLINAQPWKGGKKGADKGIDGIFYIGKSDRCIVSVKGGKNIGVAMIRDLVGVLEREKAQMGVFLTLTPPTKPMTTEAAAAGQYAPEGVAPVPRVQIVTIKDLLDHGERALHIPLAVDTYKKAAKEKDATAQGALDL